MYLQTLTNPIPPRPDPFFVESLWGKEESAIDDSIFVFSFSNLRDRFGLTDQGEEENPLHFHAGTNEAGSLLPPPLFLFALSV